MTCNDLVQKVPSRISHSDIPPNVGCHLPRKMVSGQEKLCRACPSAQRGQAGIHHHVALPVLCCHPSKKKCFLVWWRCQAGMHKANPMQGATPQRRRRRGHGCCSPASSSFSPEVVFWGARGYITSFCQLDLETVKAVLKLSGTCHFRKIPHSFHHKFGS